MTRESDFHPQTQPTPTPPPKLNTQNSNLNLVTPTLLSSVKTLTLGEEYLIYYADFDTLAVKENMYVTGVFSGGHPDLTEPNSYINFIVTSPGNFTKPISLGECVSVLKKDITLVKKCDSLDFLDLDEEYDIYVKSFAKFTHHPIIHRVTGTFVSGFANLKPTLPPASTSYTPHIVLKVTEPSDFKWKPSVGSEVSIVHSAITHVKKTNPKPVIPPHVDLQSLQLRILRDQLSMIPKLEP